MIECAKHLHQCRDRRPSEALRIEPHDDEPGEDDEEEHHQEHLVGGRLIALHGWAKAFAPEATLDRARARSIPRVKLSKIMRTRNTPGSGPSEGSCRQKEQDGHGAEPNEDVND